MKVWIVHSSRFGNGKLLAETFANVFGDEDVNVGWIEEVAPEQVVNDNPDLIIVGTAVRMFMVSLWARRWVRKLKIALKRQNKTIPFGAVFITHGLEFHKIAQKGNRFYNLVREGAQIEKIYSEWFPGRVVDVEGPFYDGVIEFIEASGHRVKEWINEEMIGEQVITS